MAMSIVAFVMPVYAEVNNDRIPECMYAGYRPGSSMFAQCIQEEESSGLGMLDSPQFAPPVMTSTLPLPPSDSPSPYGAPNVLLDAPDQQPIQQEQDPMGSPVWDWRVNRGR